MDMRITYLRKPFRHSKDSEISRVTSRNLMPVYWREPRVRQRTHRMAEHLRSFGILIVIKKHTVSFLLPPLWRCQRWQATFNFTRQGQRGRRTSMNVNTMIRTFTCMPLEPPVFAIPFKPISSSSAFTSSATRRTSSEATPGPGQIDHNSSDGQISARTGCGWGSMHPKFTIQARPAASTTTSSAKRPKKWQVTVRNQEGRWAGARF